MAAVVSVRVYTGTSAQTESATGQTGIDLISTDNSTNSPANRTTYPVTVGTNSYSKHIRLKIDSGIINSVGAVQWYTDGTPTSNVALRAKEAVGTGGASPGTGDSTPANSALTGDIDAYSRTTGSRGTWDASSYTSNGHVTKALVLQLQPNASAAAGNWSETISYTYDEM